MNSSNGLLNRKNTQIVHLASSTKGGAGMAANRIHSLFLKQGYNSILISKEDISIKILYQISLIIKNFLKFVLPKKYFNKRREKKFNKYESAYCFYQRKELREKGLNRNVVKNIKKIDFLFVHWISDFLNIYDIEYLKSKHNCEIIFVMLDHAHITGGYHFLLEEYSKYRSINGIEVKRPDQDLFYKQLHLKKQIINRISPQIMTFSKRDLQLAKQSEFNFSKYWLSTLPINHHYFKPSKNLKNNKKIKKIFSCAYSLDDFRKGSQLIIQVLTHLDKLLNYDEKIIFLCSEIVTNKELNLNNVSLETFKYSEDPETYSKSYLGSDVFLFTSIDDSAPQMPSEALLCGIPVISFNIANISELITNENDGIIVENFSVKEMAQKTYNLLYHDNDFNSFENKLKRHHKMKSYHDPNKILNTLNEIIK